MQTTPPTTPTPNPSSSAAVQAAVEQERRFGQVERTVGELQLQHSHFLEIYTQDKEALAKRLDEILTIVKDSQVEVKKTNGSVADVIQRVGTAEALLKDQAGDIEELSGGLQGQRAQSASLGADFLTLKATASQTAADVTALQKSSNDATIQTKAFWRTLGMEWKVLLGLLLVGGGLISLIANATTIIHQLF